MVHIPYFMKTIQSFHTFVENIYSLLQTVVLYEDSSIVWLRQDISSCARNKVGNVHILHYLPFSRPQQECFSNLTRTSFLHALTMNSLLHALTRTTPFHVLTRTTLPNALTTTTLFLGYDKDFTFLCSDKDDLLSFSDKDRTISTL